MPRATSDNPHAPRRKWRWWKIVVVTLFGLALIAVLAGALLYYRFLGGYRGANLQHAGVERQYGYYLPDNRDPKIRRPIIVMLHGAGMTASMMAFTTLSDLRTVADSRNSILLYPEAIDGLWNDRMGGKHPKAAQADDAAFIAALVDHFVAECNGDPEAVYVIGASNGAVMAYRLACEYPGKWAALACFLGSMGAEAVKQATNLPPVPIWILNATKDPVVKWQGGPVMGNEPDPLAALASVDTTVAYWTNRNQANPSPRDVNRPDTCPSDGSIVVEYFYSGLADVVLIKVDGADHSVPTTRWRAWVTATTNRDIDSLAEALKFLYGFRRESSGGIVRVATR